ncbi:hypothetical protein [Mucilaginibacter sp. NFX135]
MERIVIVAYKPKPGKADAEVCDYVNLNSLSETANMFAEFIPAN